jgi:DNA-binding SARP family transcriptional activator/tetratricopeptide (TPR) repeat protein
VLLRRLSVFRGGFTLDAAEHVGAGDGVHPDEVLDLLAVLVDRSLVTMREHHGATRYYLLEALRQYAARLLTDAGEEEATRHRFIRWVDAEVGQAEPHFIRRTRRAHVERLYAEIDNIRSALGWSHTHDPELHVRMAGRLWWFWFSTQHWTEGGRWIQGALQLAVASAPTRERAALLFASGALLALQARAPEARAALGEAVELARAAGDGRLAAYASNYLGMTYAGEGRAEALEHCRAAETWFREHDDLYGLRLALLLQGSMSLGGGRLDDAERLNAEGVRVARQFGQPRELAVSLQNLAAVLITRQRLDEAEQLVREALASSRQDPSYFFIATGIGYVAEICGLRGDHLTAARLMGCVEATREAIGARGFPIDRVRQDKLVEELRSTSGPAFEAAWAEGRQLDPLAVVAEHALPDAHAGAAAPDTAATASIAAAASTAPVALPASGAAGAVAPATNATAGAASAHATHSASGAPAHSASGAPAHSASGAPAHSASGVPAHGAAAALTHGAAAAPASPASHDAAAAAAGPPPQLRVRALGAVLVEVDGERIEPARWAYGKPKELLAFLLLNRRGTTRDQIGEALWPGAPRSNVKNSFHVTLHHLRKALGRPAWIVREADRYLLEPSLQVELDAATFETAAREALRMQEGGQGSAAPMDALRRAHALYAGDLLEDETCGRWIDQDRDRLRRLYLDVSIALGTTLEATDPDAAAALYETLVAREELDEELHRRMMRLRVRGGDRVLALRHYQRLVTLLRHTLDADPEPETVELYEQIRTGAL